MPAGALQVFLDECIMEALRSLWTGFPVNVIPVIRQIPSRLPNWKQAMVPLRLCTVTNYSLSEWVSPRVFTGLRLISH